jgi:hypothetical protein
MAYSLNYLSSNKLGFLIFVHLTGYLVKGVKEKNTFVTFIFSRKGFFEYVVRIYR